jgi:hypothetical protein
MRPVGIGDVAVVACRDAHGCLGWIEAYRDGVSGHSMMAIWSFSRKSVRLSAPHFGEAWGSRRRLIGIEPSPARQE